MTLGLIFLKISFSSNSIQNDTLMLKLDIAFSETYRFLESKIYIQIMILY